MREQDEFDFESEREEQEFHLRRVGGRIGPLVLQFCAEHIGGTIRGESLRKFVNDRNVGAPASPDRILRDLRQKGLLGYECVDRRASLYKINWVNR